MKYFLMLLIAVLVPFIGEVNAQKKLATGTISGTVTINAVSGNNLGNFGCANMTVSAAGLGKNAWKRSVAAAGEFSTRKCRYTIPRVLAGTPFVVTVAGDFPKGCDLKVFKADSSFPMTLKAWDTLTFSPTVQQITCTLVK